VSTAPADEGLAPERTALAWQRTGLAVVLAGVAVLRLAVVRGAVVGVVTGTLAVVVAVVVLVRVRLGEGGGRVDGPTVPLGPAGATAVSIALLGCAAAAVELQ
jgi:hypothetical protein